MERIIRKIEEEAEKLDQTKLCQWLRSDLDVEEDRLAFAPSMLFFVLGFKDMLTVMQIKDPKTEIEKEINTHCQEDLDHWKWYLRDLEQLGFIPQSWGSRMSDMFKQIWGDESFVVRHLVYTIISRVKKHNNPLLSLIVVEYLEAAFAVFIRHMSVPIHQMGYYNQLKYFGKLHVEKEAAHSRGSWVDGHRSEPNSDLLTHTLDEETYLQAEKIIDEVSQQMLNVFEYWYSTRNDFMRFAPKDVETENEKAELIPD